MNEPLLKKTLIPFSIAGILLCSIHGALVYSNAFPKFNLEDWFWNYIFLIPITLLGLYYIVFRFKKSQKITSIGKNYILFTVVKMILALVFLLPWLLNKDETSKPMIIQFFSIFFPFLLVETILLVRLLNVPLDEKLKNEENQH